MSSTDTASKSNVNKWTPANSFPRYVSTFGMATEARKGDRVQFIDLDTGEFAEGVLHNVTEYPYWNPSETRMCAYIINCTGRTQTAYAFLEDVDVVLKRVHSPEEEEAYLRRMRKLSRKPLAGKNSAGYRNDVRSLSMRSQSPLAMVQTQGGA